MKFVPCLSAFRKMSSIWIKDLNVRPKIKKLLEEILEEKLQDFGVGDDFLGKNLKAQATKEKLSKWVYIILRHI